MDHEKFGSPPLTREQWAKVWELDAQYQVWAAQHGREFRHTPGIYTWLIRFPDNPYFKKVNQAFTVWLATRKLLEGE